MDNPLFEFVRCLIIRIREKKDAIKGEINILSKRRIYLFKFPWKNEKNGRIK